MNLTALNNTYFALHECTLTLSSDIMRVGVDMEWQKDQQEVEFFIRSDLHPAVSGAARASSAQVLLTNINLHLVYQMNGLT